MPGPLVAGMFYPAEKKTLLEILGNFFKKAETEKQNCKIVISPHAGYVYSGQTAAHAIGALGNFKKFIVLGPNHYGIGPEFAIMGKGTWATPLGEIKIDAELGGKIQCGFLKEGEEAFEREHSIEVQLPFLQYWFKEVTLVPVLIQNRDYSEGFRKKCETLGKAVAKTLDRETGLVASSDFSHYLPRKIAQEKDRMAIERIKSLDTKAFFRILENIDASVCGYGPICAAMVIAKELGLKAKVLHSSDSGEKTGENEVVAYHAIGFE